MERMQCEWQGGRWHYHVYISKMPLWLQCREQIERGPGKKRKHYFLFVSQHHLLSTHSKLQIKLGEKYNSFLKEVKVIMGLVRYRNKCKAVDCSEHFGSSCEKHYLNPLCGLYCGFLQIHPLTLWVFGTQWQCHTLQYTPKYFAQLVLVTKCICCLNQHCNYYNKGQYFVAACNLCKIVFI